MNDESTVQIAKKKEHVRPKVSKNGISMYHDVVNFLDAQVRANAYVDTHVYPDIYMLTYGRLDENNREEELL